MSTQAERDEIVMTLVESARKLPPELRDSFLQSSCNGDTGLCDEVRDLIAWEEKMGAFLREPVLAPPDLPDRPFQPGELVAGRFRILRQTGQGGMGVVYEARDEKLDRRIALKCARFRFGSQLPPEVRAAREVSHFNVCKVYEIHTVNTAAGESVDFLSMEFIDGETLAARLRRDQPIPDAEIREIVSQLCAGVAQSHRQGVIHGDLKPANIILSRSPEGGLRAVITDFGLAKLHGAGATSFASARGGTYHYMAPELFKGERASIASDIYALGVIVHEMRTGKRPARAVEIPEFPPIAASSETITLNYIAGEWKCAVAPMPKPWAAAVARCLAVNPPDRFASASDLASTLQPRRSTAKTIAVLALPLCLAAASAFWFFREPGGPQIRLAILPIAVVGPPVPALGGVADDVRSRLSGLRQRLTVISRSEMLQQIPDPSEKAKPENDTPENAAKRLKATHVLQTRAEHRGSHLIVHASLIDAATGQSTRDLQGTYPDSDPSAIAKALLATAINGFSLRAAVPETVAPSAYADYAQGVSLMERDNESALQAIAFFDRAAKLDPKSALPLAALGNAQLLRFRTTGERAWLGLAEANAAQARGLNPASAPVFLLDGRLHLEAGRYEQALQAFARSLELDPGNPLAWYRLAFTYDKLNRPQDAVATYRRAIQAQPTYFRHYLDLFNVHWRRGEYHEAETVIRNLTAVAPGLPYGHENLALVLMDLARFPEAEQEIRKARKVRQKFLLGYLYYQQRRYSEAAPLFREIAALPFPDPVYFHCLGLTERLLGNGDRARLAFREGLRADERLISQNPRAAMERARMAVFAAYLGDQDRARYEVAQALQLSPDDTKLIRIAAEAYEAIGDRAALSPSSATFRSPCCRK